MFVSRVLKASAIECEHPDQYPVYTGSPLDQQLVASLSSVDWLICID